MHHRDDPRRDRETHRLPEDPTEGAARKPLADGRRDAAFEALVATTDRRDLGMDAIGGGTTRRRTSYHSRTSQLISARCVRGVEDFP